MEDIKKELAELKELVSKLLMLQQEEFNIKYGYLIQNGNKANPSKYHHD